MSSEAEITSHIQAISPYTIESLVPPRLGQTLCGVIVESRPIKKSSWGKRDPTGNMRMNLFHPSDKGLPQLNEQSKGDILILKNMKVNSFNYGKQAVSTPETVHAVIRRDDPVEHLQQRWINDTDRQVIAALQRWSHIKESSEVVVNRPTPSFGRPLLEVHAITEDIKFFDIILQLIIKVDQFSTDRTMAYLTDYTINPYPPNSFIETDMAEVVDPHLVIQGSFWDNQIMSIGRIQPGEIIKIRNAVRNISPHGELEFNLRRSIDTKPNVVKLLDDDPEIQSLLGRKAAYEKNRSEQRLQQQQQSSQGTVLYQSQPSSQGKMYQPPQQQFHQTAVYPPPMAAIHPSYTATSSYAPPANREVALTESPVFDPMEEVNAIATVVSDIYNFKTAREIYHSEIGTRCYTRATILDFKSKDYNIWFKKQCPKCHAIKRLHVKRCSKCNVTNLKPTLNYFLQIKDTVGENLILFCFGDEAVKLFPGIDFNRREASIDIIREFMEQACPINQERGLFLDIGVETPNL
ncbi:hypothetical protein K501DRAFT_335511 [Backusella circina FSU 941]|nr:hypothetical protein K501DRAFT_335511 [Backusella circina FSU 941]